MSSTTKYTRPERDPPLREFRQYMTPGREELARHVVNRVLLQMEQFAGRRIPQGIQFEIEQLDADQGMLTVTCALDDGPRFEIFMWSLCVDRWFDFVFRVEVTWERLPGGKAVFEPSELSTIIGFSHVEGASKWVIKAKELGWVPV